MSVSAANRAAGKNTGLKITVIVLGVILVFGFLAMIGTVVYQLSHMKKKAPIAAPNTVSAESLPVFGDVTVPIRQGERIARIQPSGDRLIIELATVEGNSRLVMLDQATGKVLGSIAFPQQP